LGNFLKIGILTIVLLILWPISFVYGASIKLVREASTNDVSAITIVGEISPGDANEFLSVAIDAKAAVVFLNSDGGNAAEGLVLAKAIRKLGYGTAVIESFRCMSACALIWISGEKRFMSKNALVGFHAVYSDQGVSSEGNAVYGAFYGQLGLSDRAIRYLTSAPPNGFNQVTLETAPYLDISVAPWENSNSVETSTSSQAGNQGQATNDGWATEKGVDVIGYDLEGGSFSTESQDSCYAACSTSSKCLAFTFDLKNNICYQKHGGRLLLRNPNAFSGARASVNKAVKRSSIIIYGKKDSPGFDLRNFVTLTLEECVFECDGETNCAAFSYSRKDKLCSLKSGHDKFIANRNVVSGLK
jgi:hypothetical protein